MTCGLSAHIGLLRRPIKRTTSCVVRRRLGAGRKGNKLVTISGGNGFTVPFGDKNVFHNCLCGRGKANGVSGTINVKGGVGALWF